MNRSIACFLIIISMISYSFAYPAIPEQDESFQSSTNSQDKQSVPTSGMAPRMSNVVDKLLINANTLQLTEKQKKHYQ